eukprot:617975-Pleurochrysis_carterae.AAC.1
MPFGLQQQWFVNEYEALFVSTQDAEFGLDPGRRVRYVAGLCFETFASFGGAITVVRLFLRDYFVFAARRGRADNDLGPDGARALAE